MRYASASIAVIVTLLAPGEVTRGLMALSPLPAAAVQRPFEHSRHERVSCRECHGAGTDHRTLLVRSARDCAACHHDERRALPCTSCHASAALPQARPVVASMRIANVPNVTRVLAFAHERHSRVECRECHQTPVTLQVTRGCSSCHENHHRADAECTSCHAAATRDQHDATAHLSCGGAGCHERRAPPPRTRTRTLCLACHADRATHEPGIPCAPCHGIPARGER